MPTLFQSNETCTTQEKNLQRAHVNATHLLVHGASTSEKR